MQAHSSFKPTMQLGRTMNFWSCCHLLSAWITITYHHVLYMSAWGGTQGFLHARQALSYVLRSFLSNVTCTSEGTDTEADVKREIPREEWKAQT